MVNGLWSPKVYHTDYIQLAGKKTQINSVESTQFIYPSQCEINAKPKCFVFWLNFEYRHKDARAYVYGVKQPHEGFFSFSIYTIFYATCDDRCFRVTAQPTDWIPLWAHTQARLYWCAAMAKRLAYNSNRHWITSFVGD